MNTNKKPIELIPTEHKRRPPTKFLETFEGDDIYLWYITEDEYLRLSDLFGRDFQEVGLGGTKVVGRPSPCKGCGKYTEFIDWVWTAIHRGVHSREFIFKAIKEGRQGREGAHDVYCSECGMLTVAQSNNKAEGGAPNIYVAEPIKRSDYMPLTSEEKAKQQEAIRTAPAKSIAWGKWWIDDTGSTAKWKAWKKANEESQQSV